MDDKPVKRGSGGGAAVAAIALVVILLPLIYLLAIGPIVWLYGRGYVSVEPGSLIATVYYPAEMAAQRCPPFARAMEMYVRLWEESPSRRIQEAPVYVTPPTPSQALPAPASATAQGP